MKNGSQQLKTGSICTCYSNALGRIASFSPCPEHRRCSICGRYEADYCLLCECEKEHSHTKLIPTEWFWLGNAEHYKRVIIYHCKDRQACANAIIDWINPNLIIELKELYKNGAKQKSGDTIEPQPMEEAILEEEGVGIAIDEHSRLIVTSSHQRFIPVDAEGTMETAWQRVELNTGLLQLGEEPTILTQENMAEKFPRGLIIQFAQLLNQAVEKVLDNLQQEKEALIEPFPEYATPSENGGEPITNEEGAF